MKSNFCFHAQRPQFLNSEARSSTDQRALNFKESSGGRRPDTKASMPVRISALTQTESQNWLAA